MSAFVTGKAQPINQISIIVSLRAVAGKKKFYRCLYTTPFVTPRVEARDCRRFLTTIIYNVALACTLI